MATLREIAELAAVSVATASRVLNGSDHPVSVDVQTKVRAAASQLGYTPSAPARTLKTQRSRIIGVIAGDLMDTYFAEIAHGVEVEAAALGYATVMANANRDASQELDRFHVLREHQASGIVFCGSEIVDAPGTPQLVREVDQAVAAGVCVVSLAPRTFESTKFVIDNAAAGRELTSYVLSLGHRDIAFVGGIPGLIATEQRVNGYRAAMATVGAEPRTDGHSGMTQESGKKAMARMIDSGSLPAAVICANDEVAIGALAQLWAAGLRVPHDVSVAAIGGTRGGAIFGLTALTLPLAELGATAVRHIAHHREHVDVPMVPSCRLRVGTTTAPAGPR